MHVQLWSCNYGPEPMGIGPLSSVWAKAMADRGHRVDVVAAHPHYPEPMWGRKLLPYSESRDGIRIRRLPLIIGRETKRERLTQELSFLAAESLASPFLGTPDAIVSVSPSFPALLPAMLNARARRVPWYIWLQDILPDGAATTGYVDRTGRIYRWSRRLESAAYEAAAGIFVLSESFRENLRAKGVPDGKISVAYNPATVPVESLYLTDADEGPPRVICMGNVGRSQGLKAIVEDFESDAALARDGVRLIIAGSGVAEDEVRAAIRTDRVEITGLLNPDQLAAEMRQANVAAVTQAYDEGEFNVPSKLMNYLATGLPIVASVRPESEVARIVTESGSGWISPPGQFGATVAKALADTAELKARSANGLAFASANLSPDALAEQFELGMK